MSVIDEIRNGAKGIKNIIAVASGKGGVGKSTVTANLAIAFAKMGFKTAVVDADIYGPTIPSFFGIYERPKVENSRIFPVVKYGVKVMSLGLMLDDYSAVIWRGPMIMGALKQFFADVEWGETDIMLIDLPPGTGDAPLTIAQALPLKGALIVSTPQNAAAKTAARAADLFSKMNAPVFGIVENMAYFKCEGCGKETRIFKDSGTKLLERETGLPIIGNLPIYDGLMEEITPGDIRNIESHKEAFAAFNSLAETILNTADIAKP